ncbi:DNA topoisomerase [Quillaja saponaria]|uniref:DNA topoisomerase n=1 Tax=Quillaja saponaria TaxID=32244 RepID=A0AAD7LSJ9_QUISA|nr:DNA topoisomerase [Quillaja saponaria]
MGGRTINVLNVAEKPSVAKSVATILSRNQGLRIREGRSRYNKIFEFSYSIRGQPCHMLVTTSVTGHLMELEFRRALPKWHSCDPAELYHAPVRKYVPEDKKGYQENIRRGSEEMPVAWARFSALIDREIHEAVQNLVEPNQWFADAVDARQEIDLRIGASFTRFQTMLLRDAFAMDSVTDDKNLVLSYGPCQFPTLGFIVERYWEIQSHEPEEFWTINCSHRSDEGLATFNWMRGNMFDYTSAVIIYEMCVEEPTATVTNVRHHERLKYPPHPLNTIELEKRASRYFRMSSEQTMKVAEELYQAGFISYPRTETDTFPSRTDLHTIVEEQQGHPDWGSYAQRLLDSGAGLWRNPSSGGHDDKAHPPIQPTKFSTGESGWREEHWKLYELVVRHFLACVSQPAVGAETIIELDIAGELFSASGRVILAGRICVKNYLDVYRFESWGGSMIPPYVVGQQFIPTALTLDSGVTRPPPLLSEADLLSCMDKEGIGTDATMHDHIKKLLDRFLTQPRTLTCVSRQLIFEYGESLVMGYDDMGYKLWKPYLRAVMERDMKAVSEGAKSKAEVLASSLQQMKACFLDARLNKVKLFEAMEVFFERSNRSGGDEQHVAGEVVRRCGLCQEADMVLKRSRDGNFMVGCLGFPQVENAIWLPGPVSEAAVTTNICNICTPGPVYKIQFKFRLLEIPPNYNANHLGCIGGCDETLIQLIEICGTGSRMPARGRGPTAPSSNGYQSNTRQGSCIYCQETGHSSSGCPSQLSVSRNARSRGMNHHNEGTSVSCSTCGTPCALRTANTANNRGRKFYSCPSRDCNFFVWEDSVNNGTGGSSLGSNTGRTSNASRNSGRGRGNRGGLHAAATAFVSATGDPVSGRRCFVCGDPSHFANGCPNRGT